MQADTIQSWDTATHCKAMSSMSTAEITAALLIAKADIVLHNSHSLVGPAQERKVAANNYLPSQHSHETFVIVPSTFASSDRTIRDVNMSADHLLNLLLHVHIRDQRRVNVAARQQLRQMALRRQQLIA